MRWTSLVVVVVLAAAGCARGTDIIPRGDGGPPAPDDDRDGFRADVDCDDDDPSIGSSGERSCPGACGDGLERCTDGTWAACDAPTECSCTGTGTRELACEMCGLQTQQCVGGEWAPVGACTRQGACAPGAVETGAD
ncbi:MAG: hypothetical protein M3Y87_19905, partial [Myxococcota bacterium]|nr:hypothetical protein [Myxococcota bacterium]